MSKTAVRFIFSLALVASGSTWAPAQEATATPTKKPVTKEVHQESTPHKKPGPEENPEDSGTRKKVSATAIHEAVLKTRESKAKAKAKAKAEAQAKAVDLNHASKEELKKLPGVTDAFADAIIASRPYKSKADVVTKNAIPIGLYQSLRKKIAAK